MKNGVDSEVEKLVDESGGGPRSPIRVMQIVESLAENPEGLGLRQLSALLGMPKSSLFSLLKALEVGGYVKSESGGHHRLGTATLRIGALLRQNIRNSDFVRLECARLASWVNETVIVAALAEDRRHTIYSDVVEASSSLRFTVSPGTVHPLHVSSGGQIFLAHMNEAELSEYLRVTKFKSQTPATLVTPDQIRQRVGDIRRAGVCINVDGSTLGVTAVGAPVFDAQGTVISTLSIVGPTDRMNGKLQSFTSALTEATLRISSTYGFIK